MSITAIDLTEIDLRDVDRSPSTDTQPRLVLVHHAPAETRRCETTRRLCPSCGARHAINARRCHSCRSRLEAPELDPPLLRLSSPMLPSERAIAAWVVVMGRRPTAAERAELEAHPKYEHFSRYTVDALVESGQRAFVGDTVDIDTWVSTALRNAVIGRPRDKVTDLPDLALAEVGGFIRPQLVESKPRFGVGVVLVVIIASLVMLLGVQRQLSGSSTKTSGSPHAGETASVSVDGDTKSDELIIAPATEQYCAQGYEAVRVTIIRHQLRSQGQVMQPAGVETKLVTC